MAGNQHTPSKRTADGRLKSGYALAGSATTDLDRFFPSFILPRRSDPPLPTMVASFMLKMTKSMLAENGGGVGGP